jgi:hypothetical protein
MNEALSCDTRATFGNFRKCSHHQSEPSGWVHDFWLFRLHFESAKTGQTSSRENGFTVRISDTARRSVLFFGAPSPTAAIEYGGTGFLAMYHEEDGFATCYLVTAAHVARKIEPGDDVVLRVNRKRGGSDAFTLSDVVWSMHPNKNVDVAATPGYVDPAVWDVNYLNLNDAVKRHQYEFRVQCGDPISIAGLFHPHSGSSKNTPIIHSGNIALMPDPDEKISGARPRNR